MLIFNQHTYVRASTMFWHHYLSFGWLKAPLMLTDISIIKTVLLLWAPISIFPWAVLFPTIYVDCEPFQLLYLVGDRVLSTARLSCLLNYDFCSGILLLLLLFHSDAYPAFSIHEHCYTLIYYFHSLWNCLNDRMWSVYSFSTLSRAHLSILSVVTDTRNLILRVATTALPSTDKHGMWSLCTLHVDIIMFFHCLLVFLIPENSAFIYRAM